MEKNRIEVPKLLGGTCHPNLYQSLADRMFCPTPYPCLTRSLPSLTQYRSRRQFRLYRNQRQHFSDQHSQWQTGDPLAELRTLC